MHSNKSLSLGISLILITAVLGACKPGYKPTPTVTPLQPASTQTPVLPTITPTPAPRSLTICLGQEPRTLYPYGGSSRSQWSVLEAIYDGPFDTRQFSAQPVILQKLPAFADQDAVVNSVDVKTGDLVVDANGDVVMLAAGTEVTPSGCSDTACAVKWDGSTPIKMDQMALTYQLKPGITWSDGQPLTAADSVYSFQLSSDTATPVSKGVVDRTASYQAKDDVTVQWTGLPGYITQHFETNFWLPLPKHAWEKYKPADLLTADESTKQPLGWGPYVIQEWKAGDHITLKKNNSYFRASEGLPKFDLLTFRFLGEPTDNNLAALLVGECDIVDNTSLMDEQLESLVELQQDKKIKLYVGQGPEWEHVDFGIRPASYDDGGFQAAAGQRSDFFGDLRVRQAFEYCMDRQGVVDNLLFGQSSVPAGYLPPSHPLLAQDLKPLAYDPAAGKALLEQVGWLDLDGDPQTPRTASGVMSVLEGTPLSVDFVTTEASLRVEVSKRLAASLADCGIQLKVRYLTPGEMYAAGPDGILFGRKFDLAYFSWDSGSLPACQLYETSQIPTQQNNWLTVNVTGFSNSEYDAACKSARSARPDQAQTYTEQYQKTQQLYASQIPSIPLYFRLKMTISRPDLCGLEMDVSARSVLWNLESLDYGTTCQ